jgi:hypothetical protein
MVRVVILIICCFSIISASLNAQASKMIYPGEELLYEVSFLGIKLGTIRVITESNENLNNRPIYKAKAFIDSYEGIPFVDLHAVFNSWFDPSVTYSHKFSASMKEKDYWLFDQTLYEYDKQQIVIEKFKKNEKYFSRKIKTNKKWNDGLSIFFLAREFTKSGKSIKIPTVMDKDTVYTYINFHGRRENVEIKSIGYPVRTVTFNGKAEWTGIYGLTGYFEGWFSDDEASVPIKAKMNVYIGSINIELIKWTRPGWKPPRG